MLKVQAIGGYNEVGRNMTLVTCDNESLILDMGIHLDRMLNYTDDEDISKFTQKELVENGIIPDDRIIKNKKSVVGIVPSHGHLDHIAAIPYLARNYTCPIFCTPYTAQVIFRQYKDNKFRIENKIIPVPVNGKIKIGNEFTVEFVNMTHSIPHTAMLFVHTRYGTVVYANDFKLDLHPTLAIKPDMKRIEGISKNVRALVCECLRASITGRTPSESVAVQMLQDILDAGDYKKNCIFITTFSSHIERLHSIVKLAKRYNRKVLFLG
ncbi:MAG TPA: ribonuclease J, partial [Acidobacteriota bacterium]|nr:ribonuclease J [Acidobacteriota bacterium]